MTFAKGLKKCPPFGESKSDFEGAGVCGTLPKTNSSPLKICAIPKRETTSLQTIHFQGLINLLDSFQGGYYSMIKFQRCLHLVLQRQPGQEKTGVRH